MPDEKTQRERHRTTIDDARRQGIGNPEQGDTPEVPSHADTEPGEITDLGVEEPVVPEKLRGDPPKRRGSDR